MEKLAKHYLIEAFYILKKNIVYVLIPTILSSCFYLSIFVPSDFFELFFFTIGIILLIIFPLYYGQFIEIISSGQKDTWLNIFNNYWLKVFVVNIILKIPTILFGLLFTELSTLKEILSFIIDVITIYVLPLVLFKKEIISSINLGIKCLLGNMKYSAPLVILLIFSSVFSILVTKIINIINIQFLSYSISILLIFIPIFIGFTIFIAASLILKENLLMTLYEVR